jgi:hypothetical protein
MMPISPMRREVTATAQIYGRLGVRVGKLIDEFRRRGIVWEPTLLGIKLGPQLFRLATEDESAGRERPVPPGS